MTDVEMIRAIISVSRRALAQNEQTPEGERLSMRALLEIAVEELEKVVQQEAAA